MTRSLQPSIAIALLAALLAVVPRPAWSSWPPDPTVLLSLGTGIGDQRTPTIVPDSADGAIVASTDGSLSGGALSPQTSGVVGAAMHFHAGQCAHDSARFAQAGREFDLAAAQSLGLRIDAGFAAASAYARAGISASALRSLDLAVAAGMRDTVALTTDPDLAPLRVEPRWRAILTTAAENAASFRRRHGDPDGARLVIDDVERMVRLVASLPDSLTPAQRVDAFDRQYFEPGSAGLGDFLALGKIRSDEVLAGTVAALPRFYRSLAVMVPALRAQQTAIRSAFRRLKDRYPEAIFPDVYFVVGHFRSGGTSTANGLIIGTEIYAKTAGSVLEEIPQNSRGIVRPVEEVVPVVVHELTHFQQVGGGRPSLLRAAIEEGTADFVASLVAPAEAEPEYRVWGQAHAAFVRERFLREMDGADTGDWIANNDRATADWPAALGYYVGFEIARGYYAACPDTTRALRDLFRLDDPAAILRASGYAR